MIKPPSSNVLTRRRLLGTAALAIPLAACGRASVTGGASLTGAAAKANWGALQSDLSGQLVQPGDSGYATSRLLYDPRFDSMTPAGIAYVTGPGDVATCLAFARRYGLPVTARSGGHSYAGWSSVNGGLIIDVSKLNGVTVSGETATVGTGTRLVDVYNGLGSRGRAIPGGSCPSVGVAGLTLGGGIGVLSRAYGLTCDHLRSVRIVTASGSVLDCDVGSHPDLLWACQGGGGGNFGVATSFTFDTHPAPTVTTFSLTWPWAQAARVVEAWQSWAPHAPDELWSNMHLQAKAGQAPTLGVGGTYLGDITDLARLLDQLYAAAGSQPRHYISEPNSYLHVMLVEAGCSPADVQACHLPWVASGGTLPRTPQYTKSDFFTRPLSGAGIATLVRGVENMSSVSGAPGAAGGVAFDALGGAVNRVAPGATAFVHRDALFDAQYTTNWTVPTGDGSAGTGGTGAASQLAWLRSYWASMRPYASGQAYQNYIDPDLGNWRQAYYGANYARLAQIKAAYDPDRLFSFPQAV